MRKAIYIISIVITIIVFSIAALRIHPYYQYALERTMTFQKKKCMEDTLKIAFIGDSWAAYHRDYNTMLETMLCHDSIFACVSSEGYVGAKSKEIYNRLFTSARSLLEQQPDYCIMSVGINDAVAKMGKEYYTHHYLLILRLLLNAGITPIVIEMPDVNYRAINRREHWLMKIRHYLSAIITGSEMYGFGSYREALKNALTKEKIMDDIVYIKSESWNPDGFRDSQHLYLDDQTHLNTRGYLKLDSCIASDIARDIKIKKTVNK